MHDWTNGPYGDSPPRSARATWSALRFGAILGCCLAMAVILTGCKASAQEVRGKTSFGPEFRNRGNNTSEVRYDVRQNVDVKWDNGWSTGLTYRRRDVDNGSGDSENLFLFDVGYPLWKAPKKPDKTSERIEELQREVEQMRAKIASMKSGEPDSRVVLSHDERVRPTGE